MPNPKGINGTLSQTAPPDDILRQSLLKYQRQKQSQAQKCQSLLNDHNYSIKLTKLNKLERRLEIPSIRRLKPATEVITQAVIDEVENDLVQANGPDFIQEQLRHKKNLHVGRDEVTRIMKEYFPEGFTKRFPGKKAIRQHRKTLISIGPFREVSGDGHEKLSALALKMGEIGFAIYGYKDKWSDSILFLLLVPESRTAVAGGYLFLDLVEKIGCIPVQLTTDKGPEIGYQHAFMTAFREMYAPDLDLTVFPPHVVLKSTSNTPIEGFWKHFLEKAGVNIKEFILRGKVEYLFDSTRVDHTLLFYWIFVPLIQEQLDDFVQWWNNHTVRRQVDKQMPSGHVPSFALEYPNHFGGEDCRISVPTEAVVEMRKFLEEDTGKSQAQCFEFFSEDLGAIATEAYKAIGTPTITLESAWDVFVQMSPLIAL